VLAAQRLRLLLALRLALFLACGLVSIPASAAETTPPKADGAAIVRGTGRCKSDRDHDWREISTGEVLGAGISVRASTDEPLQMLLPDGVTIALEPGAGARWMPAAKLPTETNGWARGYHLVLQDGELEVQMPPGVKGSHAFLVSTRAGTLTDWRGQLHVMVHGDTTAAAIYQGALVVGSNGQGFPVYDGAGILMRKGIDPDKSRGIPPAPSWDASAGGSFTVAPRGDRAGMDLRWAPLAAAASYRIEIASEPTMVRVVRRASTTEPRYAVTEPEAGVQYWAHVRAVGPEGIVGEWSAPRAVHVLHYDLPEGAFVARDGAIVLLSGTALSLTNAEGIEVAYESETFARAPARLEVPLYWSKLVGPLRIGDDATLRIVHLRDPTLGSEARLVLARRQLRADVDLQPRRAHWPADPIDARVVVSDPSGRTDIAGEKITIEALLDLTPLAVAWQQRGATWTTRIAPRPTPGPSVVRVVVKDASGSEIGRGFLEIDTPRAFSTR
jgi:hypothetical protein